jgi:putative phosphoribosyl transferase
MKHRSGRPVELGVGDAVLEGRLTLEPGVRGLVVVVNGDWGVRYASRETEIAESLEREGFGTLVIELLTPDEGADRSNRFATDLLADRLGGVTEWLDSRERTADLDLGLFGVGPGAATVLRAVDGRGTDAGAVVTLDGRVDLIDGLESRRVPTLLVVDGSNDHLLRSNRRAYRALGPDHHRHVVLWSEDGGSATVSAEAISLAASWFETHLHDGA